MSYVRRLVIASSVVTGAVGFLSGAATHAQVVPPQLIESREIDPPEGRSGMPMEGWIVLRYSVMADGTTADVRAIDRMPPMLPDRAAVAAVEDQRFEPATADGAAIDWYNNEVVIVFDAEQVPAGPTPLFLQGYREAEALFTENEFDKALKRNERLIGMESSRLGEFALAQMQNAVINMRLNDTHAAYAAIARATDPRIPGLQGNDLAVALQYRNVLELQLGDAVGALATYARRTALGPVAADDPMAARVGAFEEALAGDAAIAIRGRLADGRWRHMLTRRTFAFGEVEAGGLDAIGVECDRRRAELEYAPDSEWSLPDSWGECLLTVAGRRDTAFVLYEFP